MVLHLFPLRCPGSAVRYSGRVPQKTGRTGLRLVHPLKTTFQLPLRRKYGSFVKIVRKFSVEPGEIPLAYVRKAG